MSTTDEPRRYLSWNSQDGDPPEEVRKAIQAHYRRFAYSRTESVTYQNGNKVDCLWPDDGVAEAQKYFDEKARNQALK